MTVIEKLMASLNHGSHLGFDEGNLSEKSRVDFSLFLLQNLHSQSSVFFKLIFSASAIYFLLTFLLCFYLQLSQEGSFRGKSLGASNKPSELD